MFGRYQRRRFLSPALASGGHKQHVKKGCAHDAQDSNVGLDDSVGIGTDLLGKEPAYGAFTCTTHAHTHCHFEKHNTRWHARLTVIGKHYAIRQRGSAEASKLRRLDFVVRIAQGDRCMPHLRRGVLQNHCANLQW